MTNELHRQLANRILIHIRALGLPTGHHLTEASLQALLGTSRAPIRAALALLAAEGVLDQRRNRGFFVGDPAAPQALDPARAEPEGDERIYLAIADDRLTGRLPAVVSEPDMMRRYDIPRSQLRRILTRIGREGWIERREGRGYSFAHLIDSIEAYRESYELRQMVEPAGLLAESFALDRSALAQLTAQQEFVRDGGWRTLSQIELFETNSRFHEALARMSGNRFLVHIVERQNQLRRLVEYRQTINRTQVIGQNTEHLAILDRLHVEDVSGAARLLSDHLGNARTRKAKAGVFAADR
jgi:DNA-binding GntR family transcriptional regulator